MNNILVNKDKIQRIKENVQTDLYYNHEYIEKRPITDKTISIVMTASERSRQTYFTLQSISNSDYKDIHIILVDDSEMDPIDVNKLREYEFTFDFIKIKRDKKEWVNPCINYNIGFKFIKGGYVIIQNAEVCHIGKVIDYIINNIQNEYLVFDVRGIMNYLMNEIVYKDGTNSINIFEKEILYSTLWITWFQSKIHNDKKYHFLTACKRDIFNKIKEFSYDYTLGISYDDDDFVLKIDSLHIPIRSINHIESNCGGIHLYHNTYNREISIIKTMNRDIFENKYEYYNKNKVYIEYTN
jgi:hypothetical protein